MKPPAAPKGQRVFLLDVPYEEGPLAARAGATYHRGYGYAYIGKALPAALEEYRPQKHSWLDWQEQELLGKHSALTDAPAPDTSTGTFTLRKDQLQDIRKVLVARKAGAPEVLVGSDMGSGKTATVIGAVKRMAGIRNVLVVCPAPVMAVWRLHLREMGDGAMDWCIINYESTKKLLKAPAAVERMKHGRARNLRIVNEGTSKVQWDVVIVDEAHWCANPESQQTRAVDKAVAGPAVRSAFCIKMTGTPGENPSRLSYLHRGLFWRTGTKPLPSISMDRYVAWCQRQGLSVNRSGYGNALAWTPPPDAREAELSNVHDLVYGGDTPWAFRRIPDWPEQQRIAMPVELSPAERAAYDTEWKQFRDTMRALEADVTAKEAAAASGATAAERARRQKAASKARQVARTQGLAAQTRYRQKAGQIRAGGTTAFVASLVEKGYQVGVSIEFLPSVGGKSPAEVFKERFARYGIEVAMFTGQNREDREDQRIAYQRGEKPVIIYTPAEGLNLHAGETSVGGNDVPRVTVIAEPLWATSKTLQKEKRGQRNGTSAPVYYMYALDTIEEGMIKKVAAGMRDMAQVNGDDTDPLARFQDALQASPQPHGDAP